MYNNGNSSKNVTGASIVDGTIANADVDASAAIAQSKLATLAITNTEVADNALSGNKIDGGTISNFASTGIDDNATSTNMKLTDTGLAVGTTTSPTQVFEVIDESTSASPTMLIGNGDSSARSALIRNDNGASNFDIISSASPTASKNMRFFTHDDASAERMRIQAGGGISFNGDTAAANALDDYEEGTFTPYFYNDNNGEWAGKTTASGNYTKIGDTVHLYGYVTFTSKAGSSGTLRIRNFPFVSSPNNISVPVVSHSNLIPDTSNYKIRLSSTDFLFYLNGGLQQGSLLTASSGTYQFSFTIKV